MAIKNLEKDVVTRIITQLQGIDGTTNYNNSIADADIHSEFLLITETHNFPTICIGGIDQSGSVMFVRKGFEVPTEIEIFGYVKDNENPITKALELLSDMRVALIGDEDLNDKTEKFRREFVAQINQYLTYIRENDKLEGEKDPIGLIICKEKDEEEVHYALGRLKKEIFVAEYKTKLPSEQEIKSKLKND